MRKLQGVAENFRISAKQRLALPLLVQGLTVEEVSSRINVAPRTVFYWLKNEAFKARLEEERERITKVSFEKLETLLITTVDELEKLLQSESESVRLRTCMFIIEFCHERIREREIVQRLDKLTEELGQCQGIIDRRRF